MSTQCSYELIKVDKLELDKNNPRIKRFMEMYGDNPTPEQIYLALNVAGDEVENVGTVTYRSLRESIKTNGGIILAYPVITHTHYM